MGWYAFENIEEALQESKQVLFPFEFSTWSKLALIIFLTGYIAFPSFGGTPAPTTDFDSSETSFDDTGSIPEYSLGTGFELEMSQILEDNLITGMAVDDVPELEGFFPILGLFILGLVFFILYITSLFEFVLFRSLFDQEVKVLGYVSDNLWNGLQYFLYRILFLALIVLAFLLLVVNPWIALGLVPLGLAIYFVNWIVFHFALPNMVEAENNIVQAFRESLGMLSGQVDQAVLYFVVRWFLGVVIGIVTGLLVLMIVLTMLIPVAIAGILVAIISPLLLIPVGLFAALVFLMALVFIAVPFRVYLYTYIIQVYGDFSQ